MSKNVMRVMKDMMLLGEQRKGGVDRLTAEEVARIPQLGLTAMLDARELEWLDGRDQGAKVVYQGELLARIERLEKQVEELTEQITQPPPALIDEESRDGATD